MSHSTINAGVSPYLIVNNAAKAIEFYCSAFGAEELLRLSDPVTGKIGHAELQFGKTRIMLADEYPDFGAKGPLAFGGSPVSLHLDLHDVDAVFAHAVAQGAVELRALKDEFHGSRSGVLTDPFGHTWHLQTVVEEVSVEEMQRRWNEVGNG